MPNSSPIKKKNNTNGNGNGNGFNAGAHPFCAWESYRTIRGTSTPAFKHGSTKLTLSLAGGGG